MAEAVIEINGLRKEFWRFRKGRVVAIDNLDLLVPVGGVFGFLGRNGAGKTTTIRCLLGLAKTSSGTMSVLGKTLPKELPRIAKRVGSLVETPAFVPTMSGFENVSLLASIHGIGKNRVKEVFETVGLTTRGDDLVKTYSLGMKQRLGIAAALVKDPELLILDEPANGLDPAGIREIRELITSLGKDGRTVLVSSHLLSEVQQMCDKVAIIDRGRLITSGTVEELVSQSSGNRISIRVGETQRANDVLINAGFSTQQDGDRILVQGKTEDAARMNKLLGEQGLWVSELSPDNVSLEELFIELTGGEDRREAGV